MNEQENTTQEQAQEQTQEQNTPVETGNVDGKQEQPEAKFTQKQLDDAIENRLARERRKWSREKTENKAQEHPAESKEPAAPELSPEVKTMQEQMAKLLAENEASKAKETEREQMALISTGDKDKNPLFVPDNQRAFYRFNICEQAKRKNITYEEAAKEYITANPPFIAPPLPDMAAGEANTKLKQKMPDPTTEAFMRGAGLKPKE